jgi:hypothetical protein
MASYNDEIRDRVEQIISMLQGLASTLRSNGDGVLAMDIDEAIEYVKGVITDGA